MATRKTHKSSGSRKTSTSKARSSASKAKPAASKTTATKPATAKAASAGKTTDDKAEAKTAAAKAAAEPKATEATKAPKTAATKATSAKASSAKPAAAKPASAKPAAAKPATSAKKAETAAKKQEDSAKAAPAKTTVPAAAGAKATKAKADDKPKAAPAKAPSAKSAVAPSKPAAAKAEKSAAKPATAKVKIATKTATATAKAETPAAKPAAKKAAEPAKEDAAKQVAPKAEAKVAASKAEAKPKATPKTEADKTSKASKAEPEPAAAKPAPAKAEPVAEPKPEKAPTASRPAARAEKAAKPEAASKPEPVPAPKAETETEPATKPEPAPAPKADEPADAKPAETPKQEEEAVTEETSTPAEEPEAPAEPPLPEPRRSVAFIGSECYPFVKTGGLGDVMYALPKALIPQNCDVKVILPKYACIKQEYKDKMVYRGSFDMDLCSDGTKYYVGIMEYVSDDGVVYDFIDNEWFFNSGNPYTNLVDDIPKYCYFAKAALAALNYMDWIPDIVHCHDWQASLVPIYLKTMFQNTPLGHAKSILTIHNLRFQGKYDIRTVEYWSGLPSYVFNEGAIQENWTDGNMLKGGLAYADMITTVSGTYAAEIQTPEYGEGLDAHLRYHSGKLRGIVNGIDYGIWNPAEDKLIEAPYSASNVLENKKQDKLALQRELGLEEDGDKMVIGLISRLTNQKGLDLVNAIFQQLLDGNTQVVILGTGEPQYEDSFRWYENANKGTVCSNIMYDEARSHQIYAGADALLVPSRFEPCGLTQLIAMHYGTIPVVRETGGLKDTVQPYNQYTNEGNGFTFDRYESGLLLDAINRAKTLYFTDRDRWDEMVVRDMEKDVSWDNSAKQYRQLYVDLTS